MMFLENFHRMCDAFAAIFQGSEANVEGDDVLISPFKKKKHYANDEVLSVKMNLTVQFLRVCQSNGLASFAGLTSFWDAFLSNQQQLDVAVTIINQSC